MALLNRMRCAWAGPGVIGPAVTTFYFDPSGTAVPAAVFTFWDAIKTRLPSAVTINIPNTGDQIEATDGELQGVWTQGTASAVSGLGAAQYLQGVGCRVVWNTAGFTNGRRVRGSTFLAPLDASMYSTLGTLSASRAQIETAANALVTALTGDMMIWSKPGPSGVGHVNSVLSAVVPDKISTLRSRRT